MRWRVNRITVVLLVAAVLEGDVTSATSEPVSKACPFECPAKCDEEATAHCRDSTIDECGCCPVCIRTLNEECGRASTCELPYHCAHVNASTAICTKPASMDDCLHAECPIVFDAGCPSDSRAHFTPPPPGSCCGGRECVCDLGKCSAPACPEGLDRVEVKKGTGIAGKCCDHYECLPREPHCAKSRCPPLLHENEGEDEECPDDSYRPPVHRQPGACCPVQPGCRCKASICRPASCPEGKVVKVMKRGNGLPGRCCDEWKCEDESSTSISAKGCTREGRKYKDGEEWHVGSCDICRCKRGVAACSKMSCPKPPPQCTWIVIPEGECCPVCVGCQTERLEKKRLNETWSRDDCTTCTCSANGESVCEKHMCRAECDNPRKVEGQCCPVCDEPTILTLPSTCPSLEHCPLRCENGLRRDDNGCFVCDCLPSVIPSSSICTTLDADNCEKQCAHGYLRNSSGCAVCRCAKCPPLHQCMKHCLYGFETNSVGCPVCKCRAMARIDARLSVADKLGKSAGKERCVSLSPTGKVVERDGGEWWNDGCRHCFCEQQQEFCSLISCPERPSTCPEDKWLQAEDACCPSCTVSSSSSSASSSLSPSTSSLSSKHEHTVCQSPGTGRLFTDGETWQLAPCVSCTCRVGHVLCRVSSCPPIPCDEPLHDPDNHCCPICPQRDSSSSTSSEVCTDESGVARSGGSEWRQDDCTSCVCDGGKTECFHEQCDDLKECRGVPLVLKGRCCPVCSDVLSSDAVCTYSNAVYSVQEEWRDGDCRNCSCVAGGQTVCRELVCPECSDPVSIAGQCCPLCKDSSWAFGEGSSTVVLSSSGPSALTVIGFSACGVLIMAITLALVFFLYKRSKSIHKKAGALSKVSSAVRLSSSRRLGSQPQLIDGWESERRGSGGAQSESLLSTASSECGSSVGGSSDSSGHGTGGVHSDTAPLTSSPSSSKKSPRLPTSPSSLRRFLPDTRRLDV